MAYNTIVDRIAGLKPLRTNAVYQEAFEDAKYSVLGLIKNFGSSSEKQDYLLLCALADLQGSAMPNNHNWTSHNQTINEIKEYFNEK